MLPHQHTQINAQAVRAYNLFITLSLSLCSHYKESSLVPFAEKKKWLSKVSAAHKLHLKISTFDISTLIQTLRGRLPVADAVLLQCASCSLRGTFVSPNISVITWSQCEASARNFITGSLLIGCLVTRTVDCLIIFEHFPTKIINMHHGLNSICINPFCNNAQ